MRFHEWLTRLDEISLDDLYQSTVAAFPRTKKRQHATGPVQIVELAWTPYLGVKTLFIKGTAESGESGKVYHPLVLFKNVRYHERVVRGRVEIVANDGRNYVLEKLSYSENGVLLRCDCSDFKWRFNYYDHLDKSLYGSKKRRYESKEGGPPANPKEMPGMCKHLIKLVQSLDQAGLLEG